MVEKWKTIEGFEGLYEVSNLGRVRSIDRWVDGKSGKKFLKSRVLKPGLNENGYLTVGLCKDGKAKSYKLHRLVAEAFISNPKNLPNISHINEDKTNNCVENLKWVLKINDSIISAWRKRKDYKGYDKTKGSLFNSWRSKIYTLKGKSIGFPDKWRTFEGFCDDMTDGWERGKVLHRIDTNLPYSKENCRWGDKGDEQLTKLVCLEYNGKVKTLREWCEEFCLNYGGVRNRYMNHTHKYSNEEILFGKVKQKKKKETDILELSKQGQRNKLSKMLSSYRSKDKKLGLEMSLTMEDMIRITSMPCHYCGDTKLVGADRIDNSKGHTLDNVVPACSFCNVVRKNYFTMVEFEKLGKIIKEIKDERNKAS